MGCGGGYGGFFGHFGYDEYPRRGCGHGGGMQVQYGQNDIEEKMIVLKKMYAQDIVDDSEYQRLKQRIYDGAVGFEELMDIRRSYSKRQKEQSKNDHSPKAEYSQAASDYRGKIDNLKQSKEKMLEVKNKLSARIEELQREKAKMEELAETVFKSSEDRAEEFIRSKIEVEESIQSLEKRRNDLQNEIGEVEKMIKTLKTKELELEALRLQEEISNMKTGLNE